MVILVALPILMAMVLALAVSFSWLMLVCVCSGVCHDALVWRRSGILAILCIWLIAGWGQHVIKPFGMPQEVQGPEEELMLNLPLRHAFQASWLQCF